MRFRKGAWIFWVVALIGWFSPGTSSAATYTATGAQDFYFELQINQLFEVRTFAAQNGIDSMLWLYDSSNNLLVANDDSIYGLDSVISTTLDAGTYRLRTGVCCWNPDYWYGSSYNFEVNLSAVEPTTTTTTTTTTLPSTTTTVEETTTTTEESTTTTTWQATTTVPETTTSTTVQEPTAPATSTTAPATTTTVAETTTTIEQSTTTSSTTTTTSVAVQTTAAPAPPPPPPAPAPTTTEPVVETTHPSVPSTEPEVTVPETLPPETVAPTTTRPAVTTSLPQETTTTTTISSTTTVPSTTTSLVEETVPTTVPTLQEVTEIISNPEAVANLSVEQAQELFNDLQIDELSDEEVAELVSVLKDAPEAVKQAFENTVNVFGDGFDDYVPSGSNITVAQRRVLIGATAVFFILPAPMPTVTTSTSSSGSGKKA